MLPSDAKEVKKKKNSNICICETPPRNSRTFEVIPCNYANTLSTVEAISVRNVEIIKEWKPCYRKCVQMVLEINEINGGPESFYQHILFNSCNIGVSIKKISPNDNVYLKWLYMHEFNNQSENSHYSDIPHN